MYTKEPIDRTHSVQLIAKITRYILYIGVPLVTLLKIWIAITKNELLYILLSFVVEAGYLWVWYLYVFKLGLKGIQIKLAYGSILLMGVVFLGLSIASPSPLADALLDAFLIGLLWCTTFGLWKATVNPRI